MKKILLILSVFCVINSFGQGGGQTSPLANINAPIVSNDLTASASIAANATSGASISLNGNATYTVQFTGTFTATFQIQISVDGTTFINLTGSNSVWSRGGNAFLASGNITATGIYDVRCNNINAVRVISTAYTSGTAVITARASVAPALVLLEGLPAFTLSGTASITGTAAHSAASSGNPARIAGRVVPTTTATVDQTLVAGDVGDLPMTTNNQLVIKTNGTAELDYNFLFSTAATTVTTQAVVQASGTAGVRNYVKSIRLSTDAIGAAGNVWVLDGSLTVSSVAITTGLATTSVAHDLKIGDAIVFTALAAGTGVSTNTVYYVTSVGSTTTFNFSASIGGSNVVPSVAYTGTTMNRILDQIRLQTTALTPVVINYEQPLRTVSNMALNFLIPTSLTSGNIYLTVNGFRGF